METKETQMTIDDYLNRNSVDMLNNTTAINEPTCEKLEVEAIDYNSLSKTQLVDIIETKNKDINNYEDKIKKDNELHKIEIENLNHFYTQRTNELSNLVSYYERKLKILGDIINMETGGVK